MKVQLKLSGKRTKVTYELDDVLLVPLSNILHKLENDANITHIETHYLNDRPDLPAHWQKTNWSLTNIRNTGYKPTRLAKGIY